MSIDRCKCPVCAALPSNPTLTARDAGVAGYANSTATEQWLIVTPPQVTEIEPTIFDLVKADLDERDRIGLIQHGDRRLTGACGYDWLQQAYDEALDLCVYLRGALAEREQKK